MKKDIKNSLGKLGIFTVLLFLLMGVGTSDAVKTLIIKQGANDQSAVDINSGTMDGTKIGEEDSEDATFDTVVVTEDLTIHDTLATTGAIRIDRIGIADAARTNTALSEDYLVVWTSLTASRNYQISSEDIAQDGRSFVVKDQSGQAGTFPITISTEGSEKIDGQDSISINANYGAVGLYSDGSGVLV